MLKLAAIVIVEVVAIGVVVRSMSVGVELVFPLPPWPYLAVATLATSYQAYRGYELQRLFGITASDSDSNGEGDKPKKEPLAPQTRVALLQASDAWLYAVCSSVGFVALWLLQGMARRLATISDVSAGASALLLFLSAVGVLGVAGQLPHLVQSGKWPLGK